MGSSPQPGAPQAYVTTPQFLSQFGFKSLRDLADLERLQDAGLLGAAGSDQETLRQFPRNDDAGAFDLVRALDPAEIDQPHEDAA